MGDEEDRAPGLLQEAFIKAEWRDMVAANEPITLMAADVDKILSAMFSLEAAFFRMNDSLSRLHAGDPVGSLEMNRKAMATGRESLNFLNEFPRRLVANKAKGKAK